jgi:hypothetical protein
MCLETTLLMTRVVSAFSFLRLAEKVEYLDENFYTYIPCQLFYAVKSFCLHHSHHIDLDRRELFCIRYFWGKVRCGRFLGYNFYVVGRFSKGGIAGPPVERGKDLL